MTARGPLDGWVECACGARHWGRGGAAGLLLARVDHEDPRGVYAGRVSDAVVLQHRAAWSHQGGTWGIPGGALAPGEDAIAGALRESHEEAGIDPSCVRVLATSVLAHPDWSYTTVLATSGDLPVHPTDAESDAIEWVPVPRVSAHPLHPGFAAAWPVLGTALQRLAARPPLLVIDAANVIGARPDGWWRDRAAAAGRLLTRLEAAVSRGFPASWFVVASSNEPALERVFPDVVVVLEGAARHVPSGGEAAASSRVAARGSLRVVRAQGSGDDAVVHLLESVAPGQASVVTADRGLRERLPGVAPIGPQALWRELDQEAGAAAD